MLAKLNELGERFGNRSRFVMLALDLADSVVSMTDAADEATIADDDEHAHRLAAAAAAFAGSSIVRPLENERGPAYRPGRAEASVLGREKEVTSE